MTNVHPLYTDTTLLETSSRFLTDNLERIRVETRGLPVHALTVSEKFQRHHFVSEYLRLHIKGSVKNLINQSSNLAQVNWSCLSLAVEMKRKQRKTCELER